MTVSLFHRFQVADFDAWLNPDTEQLKQMMASQGVQHFSLHRNADDRNSVMVHLVFADEGAARSFATWYEGMKAEWEPNHPGSKHEIVEAWVGEDVPGYRA